MEDTRLRSQEQNTCYLSCGFCLLQLCRSETSSGSARDTIFAARLVDGLAAVRTRRIRADAQLRERRLGP